jgi:hypothetical protein
VQAGLAVMIYALFGDLFRILAGTSAMWLMVFVAFLSSSRYIPG